MENNETNLNLQPTKRELLFLRLKKIHRTQTWLSKEINENSAYVSMFFSGLGYAHLEDKIEKRIIKEELKIQGRIKNKVA